MEIKDIKKVACIGAGVIGYSWAVGFALKELEVALYDINDDVLKLAQSRVHESLNLLIRNQIVTEEERTQIEGRITYTTSIKEAVTGAGFIQESGPEHYDIKHEIIKEIETYANPEAIIASSTSRKSQRTQKILNVLLEDILITHLI